MNNTRTKPKYSRKRPNEKYPEDSPLLHHSQPTSPKEKILKAINEILTEQCNKSKLQKLLLPIFLSCFLFFCMHIMNTTTESYGPQTLSKIIQKQGTGSSTNRIVFQKKNKLYYFQSQQRPRESIKLLSENFIEEYYATFINNQDKIVIVAVVSNIQSDIDKLCNALRSLVFLQGDEEGFPSPVLVFQEGDLSSFQYEQIVLSTTRPVAFPMVDFQGSFPRSFNLKLYSSSTNSTTEEEDLGYKQMLRFWISGIWKHDAIKPYDIIMRIDSDSCFKEVNAHLPNFVPNKQKRIQFHSQYVGREPNIGYVKNLYTFTLNYIEKENIIPSNTVLWHFITDTNKKYKSIPVFMTHNSILRKSFFQSKSVQKFHDAITESSPFGVYYYRWADSSVYFLSAAIFLQDEFIMTNRMNGYYHREGCRKSDVELAIEMFNEKKKWSG